MIYKADIAKAKEALEDKGYFTEEEIPNLGLDEFQEILEQELKKAGFEKGVIVKGTDVEKHGSIYGAWTKEKFPGTVECDRIIKQGIKRQKE